MRVRVVNAAISYGNASVFSGVSGEFASGNVTALVGPSGSGKSSLLSAIAGYQALRTGRIELEAPGLSTTGPSPDLVAWVPQGSNALGRRSVLDNVLIAALAAGESLERGRVVSEDALKQVGLLHRAGEHARLLSGGELQRVAIARALASAKPLILADEPSAHLDAENTNHLAAILSAVSTTSTIIVATHDPILIETAGHRVFIRRPA